MADNCDHKILIIKFLWEKLRRKKNKHLVFICYVCFILAIFSWLFTQEWISFHGHPPLYYTYEFVSKKGYAILATVVTKDMQYWPWFEQKICNTEHAKSQAVSMWNCNYWLLNHLSTCTSHAEKHHLTSTKRNVIQKPTCQQIFPLI